MKKIKILVADDHALLRVGLNTMLNAQPDMTVVGEAGNGRDAVSRAKELKPDVVIMDLMMPKLDGAEATRQIVESLPETKVVILTSYGTSVDLVRAISYGAVGAQMKGSPIDAIIKAIRTINSGGKAIAAEILRFLKEDPTPTDLSKRQREVLLGVAGGKTSDQIADELGISVSAVKQHITAACEKLGASSRAEAAAIALRKHLLKL
jgi:NarL family two-component system response regulator LiaR